MKTGFKDKLAPKAKEKEIKSPWSFTAPQYDDRSGCALNAGTDYHVGVKQPVGSLKHSKEQVIPQGRVDTLSLYPHKRTEIE